MLISKLCAKRFLFFLSQIVLLMIYFLSFDFQLFKISSNVKLVLCLKCFDSSWKVGSYCKIQVEAKTSQFKTNKTNSTLQIDTQFIASETRGKKKTR